MASNPEKDASTDTDPRHAPATEKTSGTLDEAKVAETPDEPKSGRPTGSSRVDATDDVATPKTAPTAAGSTKAASSATGTTPKAATSTTTAAATRDDGEERRRARTELELARANNRRLTDLGLLVVRLIPLLVLIHGIGKLNNYSGFRGMVSQTPIGQAAPDLVAVLQIAAEVALPVALLFGVLTRLSGLLLAISFGAVWTFIHFLPNASTPITSESSLQGEPAMAFALVGLALFLTGGGRFAIDRLVMRRRIQARAERRAEKHA